ncbi:MAG TPA: polysaccharide deacetylase family protein [Bacteroidales bacterium]|jgi:peptidoglycan/xylan/chitin deacetylase (PgdA/CDA1 family)|nr:polysaccharide deacetylase family protein [Bacteroidales bacterium]HNR41458.1 polysaccharide deacetylase family protein [Bacteroidales bacterium]HPM17807.1 polysaccharide deacetylase family protein [Bacteroidales bacterium]HQG77131.1 polysaccharide deacetylase family protein [Bacteroidales bacterium]
MLKYKKICLLSLFLLMLLLLADQFIFISAWFYIGTVIATLALLAYGSAAVCSGFYCRVICSGSTSERIISLTFDDGPHETLTPAILDILNKYDVKSAFFCVGNRAAENPHLIMRMDKEGHIIGNHSGSHHFLFDLFSRKKIAEDLEENDKIIDRIINKKVSLFRPPYGVTNPAVAAAVRARGYTVIGWSLKSRDTVIKNENLLLERLGQKLKNGGIILFHDNMDVTARILDRFIQHAAERNFRFERLDHLLKINAYE